MKTKVLSYPDVDQLVFDPELLHIVVEEEKLKEYVDKELKFFRKKHGTTVDAGPDYVIEEGDIVMVKATSELPKFNRPMIPVSVGKGLFDKVVEEALLGLHLGEKKEITIEGKPVTLDVLKVKTKTEAELTWDLIRDEVQKQYPDVDSLEAFEAAKREECLFNYKEDQYMGRVYSSLREQILDKMEIEIDQDELQAFFDEVGEAAAFDAESEGLPLYDFLRRCFPNWAEYTEEQVDEAFRQFNIVEFKMEQYLQHLYYLDHPRDQKQYYQDNIKQWAKETGETEEHFLARMPYDYFMYLESTGDTGMKMFERFMEKVTVEVI